MSIPEGWFVLHQPKLPIPSVFNLNRKGFFRFKPFVTHSIGARLLIDAGFRIRVQCIRLTDDPVLKDSVMYPFSTRQDIVDLNADYTIDVRMLTERVSDAASREEIARVHQEWHQAYVPLKSDGTVSIHEMNDKLSESFRKICVEHRDGLKRENMGWVASMLPGTEFSFRRGLNLWLGERLLADYRARGGEFSPDGLVRHINLFDCILGRSEITGLMKPDSGHWRSEREPWDCWVGFVGSEEEAKRVFDTMKAVFPVAREELG